MAEQNSQAAGLEPLLPPMRVAIVGSGISGLAAAWLLSLDPARFTVTVFESGAYAGGHTNTVRIHSLDNTKTVGVDTGFIVCNPVTYPNFQAFLAQLGVDLVQSDMSFAVSRNNGQFEWCGDSLDTVFVQRSNLIPLMQPGGGIYRMLWDCLRFHRHANKLAADADSAVFGEDGLPGDPSVISDHKVNPLATITLGDFFRKHNYSTFFYENYILPMTAAIWSSPAGIAFDQFPLLTLVRFMRNHIMLQIGGRPKWRTVAGGSATYVKKVMSIVPDIRLNTPIVSIVRPTQPNATTPVVLTDQQGKEHTYDHVIFAAHTDQILQILGTSATLEERRILGSIKYSTNRAVLHRDASLMPKRKKAWASWNYLTTSDIESKSQSMCLTYWMNRLQPFVNVKEYGHVFVTMNPLVEPRADTVEGSWDYEHPIYSPETISAQESLNEIQNQFATSFCGAWTNYGFHEDGCTSGLLAAISLGATCPFPVYLNGGYPTLRVPLPPPAHLAALGLERYQAPLPRYLPASSGEDHPTMLVNNQGVGISTTAIFISLMLVVMGWMVYGLW
ncbi:hypothetical protein BASA61_008931 [Batrachochytrium salamandrivorans]|nr:hypothetical protein BASA60_008770 [Batrachochytrium salamandrivorans]KAH6568086.1 hypothetical protein BASA60_008793 [Batrachochytrium salamandrivorans]KAH6581713.1 hypothetical protein BASA61_008931 [Batrachochytrium salamandrivorans]KAH9264617.1 hypothetical protein BASA83_011867 [Batrachochytrium salamandrivorans]